MGFLVRFARLTEFTESALWQRPSDIPERALRYFRAARLSIYLIDALDDLSRLVPAFALADKEGLKAQALLYTDEESVRNRGIQLSINNGGLPDLIASSWHREAVGLSEAQLADLCFDFACRGHSVKYPIAEVKALVARSHNAGFITEPLIGKAKEHLEKVIRPIG